MKPHTFYLRNPRVQAWQRHLIFKPINKTKSTNSSMQHNNQTMIKHLQPNTINMQVHANITNHNQHKACEISWTSFMVHHKQHGTFNNSNGHGIKFIINLQH